MKPKVPINEIGTAMIGITVARQLCSERNTTIVTSSNASVHFVYRLGDVLGHIKRYLICKPLGEALADVVHFLFYQVGHFHCISPRQQVHAQHSGIATVDATLGVVGLRFERHSCHVAHSD